MTTLSIPKRAPFTKKTREIIADDPDFAKKPIGAGAVPRVPDGASTKLASPPYGIWYPLWTIDLGGTARNPEANVEWIYQLSMFSTMLDQLEVMRDAAIRICVGRNLATGKFLTDLDVPGVHVMGRRIAEDAGGDDTQPAGDLLSMVIRFGFSVHSTDT